MAAVLALPTITDGTSYPGVMGESGVEHRTETSCRYEKARARNSAKELSNDGARDRVREPAALACAAKQSLAANRRPSAWECDGGRETALVFV
jgi:hypothetical protein